MVVDLDENWKLFSFWAPGKPQAQGSKVKTRWSMREENSELGPWRERVALAASHVFDQHPGWRMAGQGEPLLMRLEFIRPRPKGHPKSYTKPCTTTPDLDKQIRAICDALTNVVYHDDAQIVEFGRVVKRYAEIDEPPGVNVEIERLVVAR